MAKKKSEEVDRSTAEKIKDTAQKVFMQKGYAATRTRDIAEANKVQLLEFGVVLSQIEISHLCTVINNNHFFSARKGDTGRFAAGIMLV